MSFKTSLSEISVQDGERLGAVLKRLAREKQWTQEDLAKNLGIQRTYLNRLLNDGQKISGDLILRLARVTGIPAEVWWSIEDGRGVSRDMITPSEVSDPLVCEQRFYESGTTILVDHEIRMAIDSGYLSIKPYNSASVQPASLDLTIGEMTMDRPTRPPVDAADQISPLITPKTEEIHLDPGQLVYIETAEEIELPSRIVGHLGPMRRCIVGGLFLSCGPQIDPGWKGNIVVAAVNRGKTSRKLRKGESFLTIEFHFLKTAPNLTRTDSLMPSLPEAREQAMALPLNEMLTLLEDAVGAGTGRAVGMSERVSDLESQVYGAKQTGSLKARIEGMIGEIMP